MAHEPKDFRRLISECKGFLSARLRLTPAGGNGGRGAGSRNRIHN
jgi:hypothetical protein